MMRAERSVACAARGASRRWTSCCPLHRLSMTAAWSPTNALTAATSPVCSSSPPRAGDDRWRHWNSHPFQRVGCSPFVSTWPMPALEPRQYRSPGPALAGLSCPEHSPAGCVGPTALELHSERDYGAPSRDRRNAAGFPFLHRGLVERRRLSNELVEGLRLRG